MKNVPQWRLPDGLIAALIREMRRVSYEVYAKPYQELTYKQTNIALLSAVEGNIFPALTAAYSNLNWWQKWIFRREWHQLVTGRHPDQQRIDAAISPMDALIDEILRTKGAPA